ncbi:RusA family crossover junction endodeoxyribonuclease [bacterium]|nr:RusA family crossover junction endodeoxyribonuclease [bacterium]
MTSLTFSVPWAALISDNRKYVTGYILSKEYREAKTLIGQLALAAARKAQWERQEGRLMIDVIVREPDRRRRDLNYQKAFLDGITDSDAIWRDDSQIRKAIWEFDDVNQRDKTKAGAVVTITVLDEPPKAT